MHHHALFWRVALLHSQVLLHFFGGDLGTALFSCNVAQCTLFSNILGSSLLSIMEEIKKAYFMHGLEGGPHTNDTFDLIFLRPQYYRRQQNSAPWAPIQSKWDPLSRSMHTSLPKVVPIRKKTKECKRLHIFVTAYLFALMPTIHCTLYANDRETHFLTLVDR